MDLSQSLHLYDELEYTYNIKTSLIFSMMQKRILSLRLTVGAFLEPSFCWQRDPRELRSAARAALDKTFEYLSHKLRSTM